MLVSTVLFDPVARSQLIVNGDRLGETKAIFTNGCAHGLHG